MDASMLSPDPLVADSIEIRDPEGRPLLTYDAAERRAILHLSEGDVAIRAKDGKIEVSSDRDLVLRSAKTVEIAGKRGIRLQGDRATFDLGRRSALRAPTLEAEIGEVRYVGERIEATATEALFSWGRLKQVVDRWFQFARDMYLRVEAALDTRAGRIRTEAEQTYHLRANEARVQARGDVRIDGKTINMG